METQQQTQKVTLETIYKAVQNIQQELHEIKEKIEDKEIEIPDWTGNEKVFADEDLLAEAWLSPEDMEAWKDL